MKDRIAVVTGASSGIGRAVAEELLARGVNVVANGRRREALEQFQKEATAAGQKLEICVGDAVVNQTIQSALNTAREQFGREADIVVVNAGRGLPGSIREGDESQWEDLIRTNVTGALRQMRAAASQMVAEVEREGVGKRARDIVVIGSCVGRNIAPRSGVYSVTKFAINSAAESLRRDICQKGIRVTLIEPGIVQTEFFQTAGYSKDLFATVTEKSGPLLEPKHVAETICFALSQPWFVHLNDISIRPTGQEFP